MHTTESVTPLHALAVLPGPRTSYLDHLIPLCHLWNIPLLCTDSWVYTCAQAFYPPTEVILVQQENFQSTLDQYKTFITVDPCRLHPKALQFGEFFYRGEGKTVAGFHGNPSKFRDEYWIEKYVDEDMVLIYGDYLIDYLKEKGVWERLKEPVLLGNVRRAFYEKHKVFFDQVAKPHLFPKRKSPTLFWAPTWEFPADFNEIVQKLFAIPNDFHVMIKLHPFMYRLYPEEVEFLREKCASYERFLLLEEIPLIYPFLEQADVYLGDHSSVAFDFLLFDRPLFFTGERGYPWGTQIRDMQELSHLLTKEDTLSAMRKSTYHYVFAR